MEAKLHSAEWDVIQGWLVLLESDKPEPLFLTVRGDRGGENTARARSATLEISAFDKESLEDFPGTQVVEDHRVLKQNTRLRMQNI